MHTTCIECHIAMRSAHVRISDAPGTMQHVGGGLCKRCLREIRRAGGEINAKKLRPAADTIEDVEWLTEVGNFVDTPQRISERLGYADHRSLLKILRRAGRQDLVDRLASKNELEGVTW